VEKEGLKPVTQAHLVKEGKGVHGDQADSDVWEGA
jgi:hypothetical protein